MIATDVGGNPDARGLSASFLRFYRQRRQQAAGLKMHEQLWAGGDLKLGHANFFLTEMSRSLEPPERTAVNVALQAAGAIIGNLWQQSFYPRLDAFLAVTRSIPEIITCCFGYDRSPAMATWFASLDKAEQTRRDKFSKEFETEYKKFREHSLSTARNMVFHRAGFARVEVRMMGYYSVEHIGNPVQPVPIAENNPNHPGPPLQQVALPLELRWDDFTIDGKPLFPECQAYLGLAGELRAKANEICQRVHGCDALTIY